MRLRLSCLLLITGLLWAQAPAPAPDIPSYEQLNYPPLRQVEIPEVITHTLPNGMKLYLLEDHELPLIGGFALVRTGNLFDPPGKIGLAHFTGEVLRSGGTREKTGDQIDEQLENIAASVESAIGETSGTVSFNCLRENIDEVLPVFMELLTAPEFRPDKLELAKTQYRGLIARRNDDAGGIASREFAEILYGRNTPYGWRVEYEHVDRVQREDLITFHRRYFFPANIMLAMHGDFSADEMKTRLEQLFAGWDVKQQPVPPFPPVRAKPAPGINLAVKEDVNQTSFRIGHLGGLLNDKDYPALEVMADILGGGFSSRLFKRVRTELGLAYGIGASWGANYNHPGLFRISGSTKSASTTETIEVILEEVEKIRSGEVTVQELRTAKETVLNSFVFNFDQPSKTLNRLVVYAYHGYPKDFIFQYQKAVAAVTKAGILRVANKYLRPGDLTIVVVGKPADFGRPLTELGMPVTPIDLTIPEPEKEVVTVDAASLAKGKQLLQRAQEAMGGAGKLASVKDMTRVTELTLHSPRGGMKVKQKNQWLAPSHFRQNQELPFGKMSSYSDGETGWLSAPQGVQPMPAPVIRQVQGELMRFLPRLLLSDQQEDRQVNYAGDGTLEISFKDGDSVRLRIDEQTALPLKLTYQSIQMRGPPSTLVDTFADWKEVEGIRMPFKITILREGDVYAEVTVQDIQVNTGLTVEELSEKP